MPSLSIFSLLRSLIEDCQIYRDLDGHEDDCEPGCRDCLNCDYIRDVASDIIDLVIAALHSDEVRDAIYEVVQ